MKNTLDPRLAAWLSIAAALTVVCLLVEVAVQQSLRMTANDPQIQMAEDAARAVAAGRPPASLMTGPAVDIAADLAPWLAVYDSAGRPIASSGRVDGRLPELPAGVFAHAAARGETRLTWMPRPGVRSATVTVTVTGLHPGFIVAGRSLREVERREDALVAYVFAAWIAAMAVSLPLAYYAGSHAFTSRQACRPDVR